MRRQNTTSGGFRPNGLRTGNTSRARGAFGSLALRLAFFSLTFVSLFSSWAAAEVPLAPLTPSLSTSGTAEIGDVLRIGREMELGRKWADALSHYESALRQFPMEESLQVRFQFCRLHYDLGRRYCDRSYDALFQQMSFADALRLYNEVVVKIQSHHIDAPNWKQLVDRGTNNLEIALSEPAFRDRHLPSADPRAIEACCREIHQSLDSLPIKSHDEAQNAVLRAAALAEQRLGLASTATILEYTCGATNSLDTYSSYLTPGQLTDTHSQIDGNFVGLGIELKADNDTLLIVRVISGSPSQQAGVKSGDRILAVDGTGTHELSTDQAADLLQGEAGSTARLNLLSPGEQPRVVAIRRQRVEVPSVDEIQILNQATGVAYLKLTCFQKTTSRDLDAALWDLHGKGMRSLIMDLRGNPGGLLITAVEVADKFVQEGVIVTTRGRNMRDDFTYVAHEAGTWRVPLVVIIDDESASAAEIFAGAIRDHGRGVIVGTRSYGKGTVQGIFHLANANVGLRLTTAKFYSPKGFAYSGIGVEPHIPVTTHRVARPVNGTLPEERSDTVLEVARERARQIAVPR